MQNRSASIFLFPRFSASSEPAGFDRELWSGGGLSNDESVLISDFQMLAGMHICPLNFNHCHTFMYEPFIRCYNCDCHDRQQKI